MFWHENSENSIDLKEYSRKVYREITERKNIGLKNFNEILNESNLNFISHEKNIADFSELFKTGMTVTSDWGPGKVVSINKEEKKVKVNIEGIEQDFDMNTLFPFLKTNALIYCKDKKGKDKGIRIDMKLFLDDTIGKIKCDIAELFGSEPSKVVLVHGAMKITEDNKKVSEIVTFNGDTLLFIIKGNSNY